MTINPQAILSYSPAQYLAEVPAGGHVTAHRKQNSGQYDLDSTVYAQIQAAVAAVGLAAHHRNSTYERDDICRILHALGARFEVGTYNRDRAYAAFLQAQVDAIGSGAPAPSLMRAQTEFEQCVDTLLTQLQRDHYPQYKVRTLLNPQWSRNLSSRRDGVFLWPDWRDPRYINVVLGCSHDKLPNVRDMVLDWAESSRLRINPRFGF